MDQGAVLNDTKEFVRKALATEGTGHDWWHIERVLTNALHINKDEHGDPYVIQLAALLHDVGDRKVIGKEKDDYSIAENFLKDHKVEGAVIDSVLFIISNISFSKTLAQQKNNMPIEFCVVQDADRLDAIGAIGIARAFAYGGSKGRPLYDPTKTAQAINTTEEYQALDSSTFHHFEEKLLRLKDLMNTPTAKKIAEYRHAFMQQYLAEFLDEWDGNK